MAVDFLPETRKQKDLFSNAERKNSESRVIYLRKTYFRNKEDISTLSDEERLRVFVARRPSLKEWLKRSSLHKKVTMKGRILEHQEGRKNSKQTCK